MARYRPEEGVSEPVSARAQLQAAAALNPGCRSRSCQSLEEQLRKLVRIVDCVCADVQQAQNVYNKLFYRWEGAGSAAC